MQKHYTDAEKFQTAIRFLNEGKIILHNTDTIPGLAAKALREDAVDRLFEIKQRKASKAMLLLCADMRMVKDYVQEIPSLAFEALDKAGDQPLTMIYPVAKNLPSSVPATDHSIAIRIPQSALLQAFIRMLGAPLVSTSANLSGMPTALTLEEVSEEVKAQVDFILDTSLETATSQSSTLLKIQEDTVTIIREGAMNPAFRDWIAGILG